MQKRWDVYDQKTGRHSYVTIFPGKVESGCDYGSGMTDLAGVCTWEEFLAGRLQDGVRDELGEAALQEIVQAVEAAPRDPQFIRTKSLIAYLESIPVDRSIPDLGYDPRVESGCTNSSQAHFPVQPLELRSDNVALTLNANGQAALRRIKSNEVITAFELRGTCAVSLHDHFFVCSDKGEPIIIGPAGQRLDNGLPPTLSFDDMRFMNVYRYRKRVFFSYVGPDLPGQHLEYRIGRGIVARR